MADPIVPYLTNDVGSENVRIGVRKFMCMGAKPPYDHPHVFLDMGGDDQIICPYCSTLYVHDADLSAMETDPPGCAVGKDEAA